MSSGSNYMDYLQVVMGHIPNMADGEMHCCFMVGFKDMLKQKVMDGHATTFDETESIALLSDMFASKLHVKSAPVVPCPTPMVDPNTMVINDLHTLCFPQMSAEEHTYMMTACLCFKCKKLGLISCNSSGGCKPGQGHSYHQQHIHAMDIPTIPAPGYPQYYLPYCLLQVIYLPGYGYPPLPPVPSLTPAQLSGFPPCQ
ncbi:hypothetical protein GGI16_002124 [Coemansia sp. S142-1]|nr:hypothetical protein GGI16_002124 [Coemansia sp. S142-1]